MLAELHKSMDITKEEVENLLSTLHSSMDMTEQQKVTELFPAVMDLDVDTDDSSDEDSKEDDGDYARTKRPSEAMQKANALADRPIDYYDVIN